MKTMQQVPTITLNNGVEMPQIGFGTWKIEDGSEVEHAVAAALDAGYRSIDTAAIYGNESGVGNAIRQSGIPRDELFVTTKLWNKDQGYDTAIAAFEASLGKLGLDYVDMYLIHWPMPMEGRFKDSWRALEYLYQNERVRAIGVSNFETAHLDALIDAGNVIPAVNQVELHPMFPQFDMRRYANQRGIQIESWSPLMQGAELLQNPVVLEIAEAHEKTPGQVVLRWHIKSGLVTIPKSTNPERIVENISIFDFELTTEDLARIDGLGTDHRIGPDPKEFH